MKQRIAIISEHASPLGAPGGIDCGGQNVYVAQVARNLAKLGYEDDIFTRRDADNLPIIMPWMKNCRVIHVPAGPARVIPKEELLPHMAEFATFMEGFSKKHEPYDLIHANFWMSGLVAAELKKALGIPFVITFHALGRVRRIYQGANDHFPEERFAIEDRIVREADRIIAECPQDEEDLLNLYHADPARICIVPCGFDPSEMWPVDRRLARFKIGLDPDEPVLLQLGRMVPRKGVDNAIRGFARLVGMHGVPGRMLIVGGETSSPDAEKTPEIARLRAIAEEEGVEDRVLFTGQRGRKVLRYFYSAADVFITTPWYEPFGITPIEAMACGTVVVGANVGGIKFSVRDGETGFLVPPHDPDALGEKLATLYADRARMETFAMRGLKRANELFSWPKVTQMLAAVVESVIEPDTMAHVNASRLAPRGKEKMVALNGQSLY